jgi:hypothetical protein
MIVDLERERLTFRLPDPARRELSGRDCVRLAIKAAFPLPSTGAFTDLLNALDGGSREGAPD